MRVTALHSFYSGDSISGENIAVVQQTQALSDAGLEVDLVGVRTDQLAQGRNYPLVAALTVATGRQFSQVTLPEAEDRKHVLLVHNLFPNIGWKSVTQWRGPVVVMLHNFRYLCANGLLLREGRVCTECVGSPNWPSVRHACYRSSALATLPWSLGNPSRAERNPILRRADAVVAQSERARKLYQTGGLRQSKTHLVPGFGPAEQPGPAESRRREGWVFAGRLSPEKGLEGLLDIWPRDQRLDVIGDGPLRTLAEARASSSVRFLGSMAHEQLLERLDSYTGLIFPSICYEGAQPLVVREALSRGTPVVAAVGSGAADLVDAHQVGAIYRPTDRESLEAALTHVALNQDLERKAVSLAAGELSRASWQSRMLGVLEWAQRQHLPT